MYVYASACSRAGGWSIADRWVWCGQRGGEGLGPVYMYV